MNTAKDIVQIRLRTQPGTMVAAPGKLAPTTRILVLLACLAVVGCDHAPGPYLRNEFPSEVRVSIRYSDGKEFSHLWQTCETWYIGATDVGRFGMIEKEGVSAVEITVQVDDEIVQRLDKEAIDAIDAMQEKAIEDGGYSVSVLDSSGIRSSTDQNCSIGQIQKQ